MISKKFLPFLLASSLLAGAAGFPAAVNAAGVDITADFTDPSFRAMVYNVIGKTSPAPILDTDTAAITTFNVSNRGIQSLAGIAHLTGLATFSCSGNQLTSLPSLPPGLTSLTCDGNQLASLPSLPSGLKSLSCGVNPLAALPALPPALTKLSCYEDQLAALPTMPPGLTYLDCDGKSQEL